MNIPNTLTLLRIVLIPVFVVVYYLPWRWSHVATALVFALAAGTDWLDGYLARRWNQTSPLGAFLDPVADKLMVAVVLVVLLQKHPTVSLAVPAAIIIGREITVSALREWMAELGARSKVAVSFVGKYKTAAQMVAIILMLYAEPIGAFDTYQVGFALLYAAAVLTIWSMCLYVAAAWPKLRTGSR